MTTKESKLLEIIADLIADIETGEEGGESLHASGDARDYIAQEYGLTLYCGEYEAEVTP